MDENTQNQLRIIELENNLKTSLKSITELAAQLIALQGKVNELVTSIEFLKHQNKLINEFISKTKSKELAKLPEVNVFLALAKKILRIK